MEAARCLNFTEAAANLFISQPAFSRNISILEEEWAIELFSRNNKHKGTRLTPAGAVMYEGMLQIAQQYEGLLLNAQSIHEGKSGTLRIGILDNDRIDDRLLRMLNRFQEQYPGVDVLLRRGGYNELVQWLFSRMLDIAITLKIDVQDKDWLIIENLYCLESVLLLMADHPLSNRDDLSLYDFRGETFISVESKESKALNVLLENECAKAGFSPKTLQAPDTRTQMLYLESGKGIAIGGVNNMVASNRNITMVRLRDLRPLEMVMAWNRENYNPCISMLHSCYELID